jgi:hypothetical protein
MEVSFKKKTPESKGQFCVKFYSSESHFQRVRIKMNYLRYRFETLEFKSSRLEQVSGFQITADLQLTGFTANFIKNF